MIAAVIDIGTNSVKLYIAQRAADGTTEELVHITTNTRLGEGVDSTRVISDEAAARTVEAIADNVRIAEETGATDLRIVGTSALRDAANQEAFTDHIQRELGASLEVLSEEDECRYSYLAVALDPLLGSFKGTQVVADVGGGSSELVFGRGTNLIGGRSVKIGAVRLTERYLTDNPPTKKGLRDAAIEAVSLLSEAVITHEISRVVGVGGSAVNLARMLKEVDANTIEGVHATSITQSDMQRMVSALAGATLEDRYEITGLEPERADIILGGAIILSAVMTVTSAPELIVSTRGLRHGILYEMLGISV